MGIVSFIIIVVLWGSFVYVSDYKITKVDTSASPDGTHELVLQAVGEADYMASRRVLTNIFGKRKVLAYVTSPEKASGIRCLFFSTAFPEQLEIFCAWQEKSLLNQTGSSRMQFTLLLYAFRWPIEVSCYEQKTFWSLCDYMVRSRKGIEMLVNLINIAYCAMRLLPYQDAAFSKYQTESVQEFRFALSGQIRQQVFYAIFIIVSISPYWIRWQGRFLMLYCQWRFLWIEC